MPGYAKITLLGHVGQDPRVPSQTNPDFVTFSLAVTEKWKDRASGDRVERTDWYECMTSQTQLATVVKNYVKKGNPLYIEGTPKYSTYTAKDGTTKIKIDINISKLIMLGDKQDADTASANKPESDDLPF